MKIPANKDLGELIPMEGNNTPPCDEIDEWIEKFPIEYIKNQGRYYKTFKLGEKREDGALRRIRISIDQTDFIIPTPYDDIPDLRSLG